MAGITASPVNFPIVLNVGTTLSIQGTVTDTNSSLYDFTSATITTSITTQAGAAAIVPTFTTSTPSPTNGVFILSLTTAQLTSLLSVTGNYLYSVAVTRSGVTTEWLAGSFTIQAATTGGTASASAFTLTLTTSSITLALSGVTQGTAANITVTDTGLYYGTASITKTVESILATLTAKFAPLVPRSPLPITFTTSATIGTAVTTGTAIGSPRTFRTTGQFTGSLVNTQFFTKATAGTMILEGSTFPSYNFAQTQPSSSGVAGTGVARYEFLIDTAAFEFIYHGITGQWRMWVDGQIANAAATGVSIPNDSATYNQPISFATKAVRHIVIEGYNFRFGGIVIGPTDTVQPVATYRPKCLVIGDSFADGTGSSQVNGWCQQMGAHLGWDVTVAGQGGSGLVAAGTGTGKYAVRIPYYNGIHFDVVIVQGSTNDVTAGNAASVATEAASAFALINTQWPKALRIATAPFLQTEPGSVWGSSPASPAYVVRSAMQAAASTAGFLYVDPYNMPTAQPISTMTLSNSPSGGATTFQTNTLAAAGTYFVEIGTGLSTAERRRVTTSAGASPTTYTVPALTNAHSAGETVTFLGSSWVFGTGRVGATTGDGNRDIYISSDGTHPTDAGHAALGRTIADLICTAINNTTF